MEHAIELMHRLGISPSYQGYRQALAALERVRQEEDWLRCMMHLYADVGDQFDSTEKAIEKNIQTICQKAWQTNPKLLEQEMGYPIFNRPKNSDFLSMLLRYIEKKERNA
ncbi:MAG: sporulation initiation factor Spo0A C-terminal domain-containing protein [Eubacteriales bacterium]|nr:sporulation initiation factor Spo0A C-terminal domain-containing protein [Eubacteriales bacterium]